MKFRSRFAVVGTLLAVALALLVTLPALALDSTRGTTGDGVTLTLSVHASTVTGGNVLAPTAEDAQDTRVSNPGGGVTVWVAGSSDAYNQVLVNLAPVGTNTFGQIEPQTGNAGTQGYGVRVTNTSTRQTLQVKRQRTIDHDNNPETNMVRLYTDENDNVGTWAQFTDPSATGYIGPANPGLNADNSAKSATFKVSRAMEMVDARLPITDTARSAPFLVVPSTNAAPVNTFGQGTADTVTLEVTGTAGTTADPFDSNDITGTELTALAGTAGQLPGVALVTDGGGTMYFLVAANNDGIEVTADGTVAIGGADPTGFDVRNDFALKVDARGPSISNITPSGNANQSSDSASFGATFTDPGSGLINDNEQAGYNAPGDTSVSAADTSKDGDGDDITTNEPLAVRTSAAHDGDGAARDINIHVRKAGSATDADLKRLFTFGADTDITSKGSSSWRTVANGFSVSIVESPLGQSSTGGLVYYAFLAKDRVGNVTISGRKSAADTDTSTNHVLIVDRSPPRISEALAGKGYKSSAAHPNDDADDLKSIKVVFSGGIVTSAIETLDASTIEKTDFSVVRADGTEMEVASVVTTPLPAAEGSNETVNNVVYLVLAENLPPAATPRVSVVGSISDLAGNRVGAGSVGGSIVATDKTAPVLSISVTGSVAERVAATGRPDGQVTIRVTSNEPLRNAPVIHVATLVKDDTAIEIGTRNAITKTLAAVEGVTNTWELTTALTPGENEGLYAVYVTGEDRSPVPNMGGKAAPPVGEEIDADTRAKLTLFEIDNDLALADGTDDEHGFVLTPSSAAGKTQTVNPFIRINFAEASEYPLDTHTRVTLTKLVLRDANAEETDLLGTEGTVDTDSFLVSLKDLALGKYTLLVNGTDELGNSLSSDGRLNFEVVQRPEHEVRLWPGHNLVSVPGEPKDPSIDVVLPSSHPATSVLAYEPTHPSGPWLNANREAGGTWSGALTEIDQGKGYWILTSTFAPLSVQLKERGSGEVPPTFPVTAGWNLIGVIAASNDALEEPIAAKDYLASINWSVAYTYDTSTNSWTKITETTEEPIPNVADDAEVKTRPSTLTPGQGVWVWAEEADVLAP